MSERRDVRRRLVKSADRSEKIRTYNFAQVHGYLSYSRLSTEHLLYAQDRVTDHRIGLTIKGVTSILDGTGLSNILEALAADHQQTLIDDMANE